ncbi:MAG: hypothetical protein GQ574_11260 [Crocinitomix sp.]|nr:hypothetical protein [Crocinitomix sp.]
MKHKLIILFLFLNCFSGSMAATVKLDVNFIDHEKLLQHNFDPRTYANYQQAFQDSISLFFNDFKAGQNVKIIQTLDPNLFPFYSFSAKPALHDTVRHALQKTLMSIRPITSLYLPFSSEIIVTINGGCKDRGLDYSPQLTNPLKLRQSKYEYGSLQQNFDFLKDWIDLGALPILKKILESDIERRGIQLTIEERKAFATQEDGVDANFISADARSARYYGAMLKLRLNNSPLIVFRAMETAYSGRISYAQRTLQMVYQFESNNSLLRYVMDAFNWRMNYYLQKEQGLLQNVSSTHNAERDEADLEVIRQILTINSMSSNALTRLFTLVHGTHYAVYPWTTEQINFKASDPMHADTIPALFKEQAYFNSLRASTTEMFIDAETFDDDFPKYAEIALKLGDYDFAADLYWLLENRAIEALDANAGEYRFRRFYALHKLNPDATIDKKTKRMFKRLDKKLRKAMKRHPRYKNFKN